MEADCREASGIDWQEALTEQPSLFRPRRNWAAEVKRARAKLIQEMGGKCCKCGSIEGFEFHHKFKRTWTARKASRWQRIANYKREWARGVLELLCKKCNKEAGEPTEYEPGVVPPEKQVTDDFIPD